MTSWPKHCQQLGAHRTAFERTPADCGRVLLIGEDNPLSGAPEHALYPLPEGCTGNRLCETIFGLHHATYLSLWRTNLCNPTWSTAQAERRAQSLLVESAPWSVVVLLGAKVRDAFKFSGGFFATQVVDAHDLGIALSEDRDEPLSFTLISLPHPSGRNRIWNDARLPATTRKMMSEFLPEVPWGEALT